MPERQRGEVPEAAAEAAEVLSLIFVMLMGTEEPWASMPYEERCARAANEAQQAFLRLGGEPDERRPPWDDDPHMSEGDYEMCACGHTGFQHVDDAYDSCGECDCAGFVVAVADAVRAEREAERAKLARALGLAEALRDWKHERREGSVEECAAEIADLLRPVVFPPADGNTEEEG